MNETPTVPCVRRPLQLQRFPLARLDQLRTIATEHGCITIAVDRGGEIVLIDRVRILPGDRILVVEELSLSNDAAICQVLTVQSSFGFRSDAEGDFTAWEVVVEGQKEDVALVRVARELQLLREKVLGQTVDHDVLERLVGKAVAKNQVAEYISVREVCRRYSLSRSTFDREKDDPESGLKPLLTKVRGRWKVPTARFDTWFKNRRHA